MLKLLIKKLVGAYQANRLAKRSKAEFQKHQQFRKELIEYFENRGY